MKLPRFFQSLYGRIFAIFWLTLLLVLVAVLLVQNRDPRQLHELPLPAKQYLEDVAQEFVELAQNRPLIDVLREHLLQTQGQSTAVNPANSNGPSLNQLSEPVAHLAVAEPLHSKYSHFYFTSLNGELLFPRSFDQRHAIRPLIRRFAALTFEEKTPVQRLYGKVMVAGPFLLDNGREQALMYAARKYYARPPFYVRLLDMPFRLLLVTMLISTPLLLWLAWIVTRPARHLQQAAERVAKGYFEQDLNLEQGPREFRQAGVNFNNMVGAINQMVSGQQRLLSDISHELRSPLTRLCMACALAIRKQGNSLELARIETETERMEQMIRDLLVVSRMQLNSHTERDCFSLQDLWKNLLEDAIFEAKQSHKKLMHNRLPNEQIEGNGALLCSALENVVRNAINYAHSLVEIDFRVEDHKLIVQVSDDGQGVPPEALEHLFRPFYRVASARDRQSGGAGLGLAITDSAMREHNGKVSAKLKEQGGLVVTLVFNLYKG
ncbi:MAG: envelope stress sensor histidine kinase CpxA [Enterovibrio sp.]